VARDFASLFEIKDKQEERAPYSGSVVDVSGTSVARGSFAAHSRMAKHNEAIAAA
jgi:hypothetical protein